MQGDESQTANPKADALGKPDAPHLPDLPPELAQLADFSPPNSTTIWRDATVLLAAATALLYITSHVYGEAYLDVFDLELGFQNIGLGNLAMVPIFIYLILCGSALSLYGAFWEQKTRRHIASVLIFAGGSIRPAVAIAYGTQPSANSGALFAGVVVVFIVFINTRPRFIENAKKLTDGLAKAKENSRRVRRLSPTAEWSLAAAAMEAYFSARLRLLKVSVAIMCSYLCMLTLLPSYALYAAYRAAASKNYVSILPDGPVQVPVYWVGDRAVLILNSKSNCHIEAHIANVTQSRRVCNSFVKAAVAQ